MTGETEQTAVQRRNLIMLGVFGGVGIATLLVALATLLLTGAAAAGSPGDVVKVDHISKDCVDTQYRDLGRNHTQNINAKIKYDSYPPTSGTHYYDPARWGNYPTPLAPVQEVHNLEHGGIVIQYGNQVSSGDVDKLQSYYDDDPNGILMAPLPGLGKYIAATAWTHVLSCGKFDKSALDKFKKKYRYKGPEKLPKDALEPGR